jgi:hypothetical protein
MADKSGTSANANEETTQHVVTQENASELSQPHPSTSKSHCACSECKNLIANAEFAFTVVQSCGEKISRMLELENKNYQLNQINDEQHTYLESQVGRIKELTSELNEARDKQTEAEDRVKLLQSQYDQVLQKASEGIKHLEAANEWRTKYETSQNVLMQVEALRKTIVDKYKASVGIAASYAEEVAKVMKDVEKMTKKRQVMEAEILAFRRFYPKVLAAAKELRTYTKKSLPVAVSKKAAVLDDPIAQSLAINKIRGQAIMDANNADEESDTQAVATEGSISDEDAAEVEQLLEKSTESEAAQSVSKTSAPSPLSKESVPIGRVTRASTLRNRLQPVEKGSPTTAESLPSAETTPSTAPATTPTNGLLHTFGKRSAFV